MKNICKKLSLAFLILSFFSATIVNDTTIMTYSGTGIWSWRSINSWSTSTTRSYTVRHNQTRRSAGASTMLNVAIARQNLIGSTIVSSRNFSGTSNGTFTSSLTSGTYFLRFESNERAKTFDINGSVTY
ncbi:hypothetical protein DSH74_12420 [Enterococcus faecium]|nr:hypothetical protein [Enterococcus faecium]EGP5480637.1 hypothetical protein [Enterococcus faecium]EGP5637227.1 hypothetical protein [Enterococcus faecium]EGP5696809.1 hypothetical protein [Enterococcus faecium]